MEKAGPLAQFLRARRAMVQPEAVALTRGSSARRVDGLRREEVALLAGISTDYYLKLEQGRELHPSSTVLDGIGRALALDAPLLLHLHRLARPPLTPMAPPDGTVSPTLLGLLDSMPSIPAQVLNRYLDILFVNPLAERISPAFRAGGNLVKLVYRPEAPRDAGWRVDARRAAAYLRASVDPYDDGPEITHLLADLRKLEPDFESIWELHESAVPAGAPTFFHHPEVGVMELRYQVFDLPATDGQSLGMYVPAPGSPSAERLQLLSQLTYERSREGDRAAPRKAGGTTAA
ncbi:helix-turn-helix transcriptional regulator [Demequina iriomotensis]|uniref:helix-turn-helix transcriptional regulator n=1 Tax=Demequina iriomotensis TaxID=1536641 RepID=UPI00078208F3|nr:helix-turn-helix transcriptional regulator [Demequina iriomotensis]